MPGSLQLTLELESCVKDMRLYTSPEMAGEITNMVSRAGFQVCSETFYQFPESDGFTIAIVIAESHVVVSTWPESYYVRASIDACHYTQNNSHKVYVLKDMFVELYKPVRYKTHELSLGPD